MSSAKDENNVTDSSCSAYLIKIMYLQIHGDNIIACSATEVADRIAVIEGLEEEQKSSAAQRCARIYAECNRKPGKNSFYYATSVL